MIPLTLQKINIVNRSLDKVKRQNEGRIHKDRTEKKKRMDRLCHQTDRWKWRILVNNKQNLPYVNLPYTPKSGHLSSSPI